MFRTGLAGAGSSLVEAEAAPNGPHASALGHADNLASDLMERLMTLGHGHSATADLNGER